jgi:uncharacterized protein YndB with AHSA1/START domain
MTTASTSTVTARATTQVYRVYIKATPEKVWAAIIDPEWNGRYGYESQAEYDLRIGGAYRAFPSDAMREHGAPDVIIDGEILEIDPPRRLVQTWRALWSPEMEADGFTRVTWELDEAFGSSTRLTVTHDVEGAPTVALQVDGQDPNAGGGWSFILSDLKSLLETGSGMQSA